MKRLGNVVIVWKPRIKASSEDVCEAAEQRLSAAGRSDSVPGCGGVGAALERRGLGPAVVVHDRFGHDRSVGGGGRNRVRWGRPNR